MKGFNNIRLGIALCCIVFCIIILRTLLTSAFFTQDDRINILLYSSHPIYFSFEKRGEVHYLTSFSADSRTAVPGGYGEYRLGALGKLITLEKNPLLLKNTFSRITGSMTDYFFYPSTNEIYYGGKDTSALPGFSDIFLQSSNANFFDRVYIYSLFIGKHLTDFEEIQIKKIKTGDSILLSDSTFAEQYLGYFYRKSLRSENKTVQILYSESYLAAKNMSRIIDGEGIRVVDIDVKILPAGRKVERSSCVVMENSEKGFSLTAKELASFFHCILTKGKGRVSDIVVELGRAEKEWE